MEHNAFIKSTVIISNHSIVLRTNFVFEANDVIDTFKLTIQVEIGIKM